MLRVPSLLLLTSISLFAFATTDAFAATCKGCPEGTTCTGTQGPNPVCDPPKDPVCNGGTTGQDNCQFKDEETSGQGNLGNKTCSCTTDKQGRETCTPTGCTPR
jgi:hypothetical protein